MIDVTYVGYIGLNLLEFISYCVCIFSFFHDEGPMMVIAACLAVIFNFCQIPIQVILGKTYVFSIIMIVISLLNVIIGSLKSACE